MNRMIETTIKVKGMHCVSCENKVKDAVLNVKGVKNAKVDYASEKATIEFDEEKTDIKNIMNAIKNIEYQPEEVKKSKGFFKKLFG